MARLISKALHNLVPSAPKPHWDSAIPSSRIGDDRDRRIHPPSAGKDDPAPSFPVDHLFLPPELDLEVGHRHQILPSPTGRGCRMWSPRGRPGIDPSGTSALWMTSAHRCFTWADALHH